MKECYFCEGAGCDACLGEVDEDQEGDPVIEDIILEDDGDDEVPYDDDTLEDIFNIDENDM